MGSIVFFVFLLLFIVFLFGLFSIAEGRSNPVSTLTQRARVPQTEKRSRAAAIAARRAGYESGEDYVQVTDIGLLAYRQTDEPRLVRYGGVLLDTHYLRPFIELWLPYDARGQVRFELVDNDGRLRYADEDEYDLEPGTNTVLPGTWLPLKGKTIEPGEWRLRVLASNTLLAVHVFDWQAVGGGRIQRYVTSDGEISPSLQQALQARPSEAMSLSDLLSDQEEWS
jgi:hypothetical protein